MIETALTIVVGLISIILFELSGMAFEDESDRVALVTFLLGFALMFAWGFILT